MARISFSSMYSAGVLAGAGLVMFLSYVISDVQGFEYSGTFKTVTGIAGLAMLIAGGVWNQRLQSKSGT